MAYDAENYGFQMLNDHEIMTSVQEESDPVVDETEEDEDNNNESSKSLQMLTRFLPTPGLLATDLVIFNHGQVTRMTPELALSSPNFPTTPTGGRLNLDGFNMHNLCFNC
ncbi:hypothetical protein TNCV_1451121 [Trichonephila clavipes]|nr:hypothetical protein TNCV_1451121 [Trichonephila clavipes]